MRGDDVRCPLAIVCSLIFIFISREGKGGYRRNTPPAGEQTKSRSSRFSLCRPRHPRQRRRRRELGVRLERPVHGKIGEWLTARSGADVSGRRGGCWRRRRRRYIVACGTTREG